VGLISGLVLLPVAPVRGVLWVAEKITEEVDRKYYGEGAIVKELRKVDQARRSGELDADEAAKREEELIQRRLSGVGRASPRVGGHG
jgi:gas vesicle protein GvpG